MAEVIKFIKTNFKAKKQLKENQANLFEAAYQTGLSETGRLHDLFVKIERMTPTENKNGGMGLVIQYNFSESPFGNVLVASTEKGICYMAFANDEREAFSILQSHFPKANFVRNADFLQQNALNIFSHDSTKFKEIKLHLKGSDFQLKVWQTLLKIPLGKLTTYGALAHKINKPQASRAVGNAIGKNPVAYIIPCHRVIQSTGNFGGYMWGKTRKSAIIGWESAKINSGVNDKGLLVLHNSANLAETYSMSNK